MRHVHKDPKSKAGGVKGPGEGQRTGSAHIKQGLGRAGSTELGVTDCKREKKGMTASRGDSGAGHWSGRTWRGERKRLGCSILAISGDVEEYQQEEEGCTQGGRRGRVSLRVEGDGRWGRCSHMADLPASPSHKEVFIHDTHFKIR